jgi:hypothetical protein
MLTTGFSLWEVCGLYFYFFMLGGIRLLNWVVRNTQRLQRCQSGPLTSWTCFKKKKKKNVNKSFKQMYISIWFSYLSDLSDPLLNGGNVLPSSETIEQNPIKAMLIAPFWFLFLTHERVDALFWGYFPFVQYNWICLNVFLMSSGSSFLTAPLTLFLLFSPTLTMCLVVGSKHELHVMVDFYSSTLNKWSCLTCSSLFNTESKLRWVCPRIKLLFPTKDNTDIDSLLGSCLLKQLSFLVQS